MFYLNSLYIAISARIVFPEPVGAPISTLLSEWYNMWKS